MKKVLLLLFLLIFPLCVYADGIENYYINGIIQNNGDLVVEEYFNMTGEYNGAFRDIFYKNSSAYSFNPNSSSYGGSVLHNGNGVEILEVRGVKVDDNFSFEDAKSGDVFKETSSADSGEYGVYTTNYESDGINLKIFMPSSRNLAFYIKYKIKNIAILHNDVGEIGWNVIGNNLSEYVDNLVVTIKMPGNKSTPKVWAHGPLHGESKIIDNNTIKAQITNLDSYTSIDVRVVFDKEVISESKKLSNVNALQKIISYETDEAEKANYERDKNDEVNLKYIESYFKDLDMMPSRSVYDLIFNYINDLYNVELRDNLFSKLYTYQDKVDEYEYKRFLSYLEKEDITYNKYKKAEEIIHNVFSSELKEKMTFELNAAREVLMKKERIRELSFSLLAIGSSLLTFLCLKLSIYRRKNMKRKTTPEYFRDIPSNLPPECVGLLTDKVLNGDELSADILDLILRKIITFEKKDDGSYDLTVEKNDKILAFNDNLVIKMIFKGKNTINSKKIKKINFDDYDNWKKKTIRYLENRDYVKKYNEKADKISGDLLTIGIIFSITPLFFIGFILILIYLIKRYKLKMLLWLLMPMNVVLIVLSLTFDHFYNISILFGIISIIVIKILLKKFDNKINIKVTNTGIEEKNKWNGLRNFLIDFSRIDEREIPEISLWEKYLVYSTCFGVGKEVLEAMKVKFESANIDVSNMDTYVIVNSFNDISRISNSLGSIKNSVNSLSLPKVEMSGGGSFGSSGGYSSGGGGGGGFSGGSSGGGSFGGGGGGGRF